jgi:hypothetical protein
MSFSEEQQKQYAEKLMIGVTFNHWDVTSVYAKQAENELKQAAHDFVVVHQQSLSTRSDTEIITDGLLFRGLVWMSTFSDYAHKRLYNITECLPPHIKVSCTDEQPGWENYPVLYFTFKQNTIDDRMIRIVQSWFDRFAQGRQFVTCPIIYAQNGKFGQLRYHHNMRTGRGIVVSNEWGTKKVLLDNDLSYCLRYIAENWWYQPATTITS